MPLSHRSVASWLGVLLALVLALNAMGAWVRLSGSGVAIPHWPVIDGSVLPPMSQARWERLHDLWRQDQERLKAKVAAGELHDRQRGRQPRDLAEFRTMFMTEWTHRLLAALVGVVGLGCLTMALRDRDLRRRVGGPVVASAALTVFQAVLGGMLVRLGTGHHWLFLHQANAALIIGLLLWAVLRLLDRERLAAGSGRLAGAAVAAAFLQIVVGGLLAGSRHGQAMPLAWPGFLDPAWDAGQPLAWNLLGNVLFHRWLHHHGAVLVALLVIALAVGWRRAGPRQRLALQLAGTFLAVQLLFGLASVGLAGDPMLALAHQVIGHSFFLVLVLAWYDARHEPVPAPDPAPAALAEGAA